MEMDPCRNMIWHVQSPIEQELLTHVNKRVLLAVRVPLKRSRRSFETLKANLIVSCGLELT
jgi:hypothetical protein